MYVTEFTVEGNGEFPLEMLRYDECFPAYEHSVEQLTAEGQRLVTLRRYHKDKSARVASVSRWLSFGWNVVYLDKTRKV